VIKGRRMRWVGRVARTGERTGANRILVEKSEVREILVRPGHRRKNNIKLDLQEVRFGTWTGLIWLRIGTPTTAHSNRFHLFHDSGR
jgi:hypothetical protein